MHAVREAQELSALTPLVSLLGLIGALLLGGGGPAASAGEAEPPAAKEAPADPKARTSPDDAPSPPPKSVKLPGAGVYLARDILPFAAVLSGRTVRLEEKEVAEREVTIPRTLGSHEVSLEELAGVLKGAGLHLFPHDDPDEGPLLVVSTHPQWTFQPRHHTRVVEADPGEFPRLAAALESLATERNARIPKDAEPMVAVAATRVGKILVSSPRKEDIDAVEALVRRHVEVQKTRDRLRMYQYQGRHRSVAELEEALLEELDDDEVGVVRTVIASRGNRLLVRCPESLGEKVLGILKSLDHKAPAPKPPTPESPGEKPPS